MHYSTPLASLVFRIICCSLMAGAAGRRVPEEAVFALGHGGLLYRECVTECVRGLASATPIFQVLFHKTSSPKALKPLSPQALMPTSSYAHKPSNLQTLKQNSQFPSSTHAHKPKIPQILKSSSPQTFKPTYPKALKV